jgi:predicted 2-oxoglutarate/Fe(II)-dependent dioxygenase YbiX
MKITKFDKIHYYEDVIENPYVLIKDIEETDELLNNTTSITRWKQWKASDDSYDFGYQKIINPSIIDETNERLTSINKKVRNAIVNSSKDYANEHNIDLGYLTPISIAKYSTGKEMGSHIDSYDDERSPVLSVVLYINDNYDGGELYFKEQEVLIKPTAGSLIAFPSVDPYYHQSMVVTKGLKYMSPGFWYKD